MLKKPQSAQSFFTNAEHQKKKSRKQKHNENAKSAIALVRSQIRSTTQAPWFNLVPQRASGGSETFGGTQIIHKN